MKNSHLLHHTLCRVFLFLLLTLSCLYGLKAQCPASSPLVINAVNPTESRCQASGTATVSVSGGSAPYTYNITAGPITEPAQSSNVLQSLPAGTYTVQVTDNCGTSVTGSFTISGTYAVPSPTFTTQATSCPGSSDGSLTVSVANGRAPLTYSLISPSPVTAGPQTSNVFAGLAAGTYTCQVADSCGNIQTRTVAVPAGSGGAISILGFVNYIACDSFSFTVTVNMSNAANYKPPFTTSITLPNGTVMTHVLTSPVISSGEITDVFRVRYHHTTGNSDPVTFTVTNNCGVSSSETIDLSTLLDMTVTGTPSSTCVGAYTYTFDYVSASQVHCTPITYTLVSPSGVVLATQTNNPTFGGYPAGNGYEVIRQDCCRSDTLTFDWAEPTSSSSLFFGDFTEPYYTCNDGTTGLDVYFIGVSTNWNVIVASGPASVTFANGTVHTYTYPDTVQVSSDQNTIGITGLAAGTYKIIAADACGNRDSAMTTIVPSDLRHDTFRASAVKGCPGANQILVNVTSNAYISYIFTIATITDNSSTVANVTTSPYSGAITGLSSGTYDVAYNYSLSVAVSYLSGMSTIGCDVITDTLVIPPYTQPVFASSPAVANCGSVRDVALLPDSASGVSPYEYQITAGPTTTSAQASPVFSDLSAGTYTFQMTDACANSYSSSITINTLAMPAVSTTGGGCVAGSAAMFTLPASPFYSYTWLHPDGTTTTGDTLAYNPITSADTGTYTITLTSSVGGCTSTSSEAATLGFCTILAENLLNFSGRPVADNIQLSWETAGGSTTSYFIVERSTDGMTYTAIQQLEAAGGESSHTYTATDTHVPSGTVYYRLQIVDIGGGVSYSQVISFNIGQQQAVNVYPRLITGNTPLTGTYPATDGSAYFRVIGVDGRIWRTIPLAAGTTQTAIDVAGLPRGNYFIVFTTPDNEVPMQVWKE